MPILAGVPFSGAENVYMIKRLIGSQITFTFPGDGNGYVKEIVADLLKNGYNGGFSIEPHMAIVFHDKSVKSEADIRYNNYVEYGKRFMKIVDKIR